MGNVVIKLRDNTVSVNGLLYQTNGSLTASVNAGDIRGVDVQDDLRNVYIVQNQSFEEIVDETGSTYGADATAVVTALNNFFSVDNPSEVARKTDKIDQFSGVDSWDSTKAGQVIVVKSGTDQGITNSSRLLTDLAIYGAPAFFDDITMVNGGTVDGRDIAADGVKLDTIATGAEVNVQSDWNASSGDALILNKPTLATVATSGSYDDLTNKPSVVLDEQYELDELKRENNIEIGSVGTTSDRIYDVVNETIASDSTANAINLLGFWDGSKMTMYGMVAVGAAIPSPVQGAPLYLATNGAMTHDVPTTQGYIARVIGHYVVQLQSGDHMVFFNPSNSWVEID